MTILSVQLLMGMAMSGTLVAQDQPTTQPAGRGARGPRSSSPRDQLPFSNGEFTTLNPNLPTLFIAGDSTAARGDPDHRGWGAVLVDYFDTTKINLCNQAQGGASFPSYFAGKWPGIVAALKPGDYVIIELGHNGGHLPGTGDESREGTLRTNGGPTGLLHTYGRNLSIARLSIVRRVIGDAGSLSGLALYTPQYRGCWVGLRLAVQTFVRGNRASLLIKIFH